MASAPASPAWIRQPLFFQTHEPLSCAHRARIIRNCSGQRPGDPILYGPAYQESRPWLIWPLTRREAAENEMGGPGSGCLPSLRHINNGPSDKHQHYALMH